MPGSNFHYFLQRLIAQLKLYLGNLVRNEERDIQNGNYNLTGNL